MGINKFFPYSRQSIDEDDIKAVIEVLRSDYVTQGPKRGEFEKALAEFFSVDHVCVLATGSAALHSASFALGIKQGDEVLVPNNTFAATANGIVQREGKPVFVDNAEGTFHMSIDDMESKITNRTVGIIPMHYGGMPSDMKRILEIAEKRGLWVLEDAAHALGATYKGEPLGSCKYSQAVVFSFHPVKPLCTGEGGALVTNDAELCQNVRDFANSGITKDVSKFERPEMAAPWYAEMHSLGCNYRITEMQCALGLSQLSKLASFIKKRNDLARIYKKILSNSESIRMPLFDVEYEAECAYHLFPVLIDFNGLKKPKAQVMQNLREKKIGTQVHYIPLSFHPFYQKTFGYSQRDLPNSERIYKQALSLPISVLMQEKDVHYVCENLLTELGISK